MRRFISWILGRIRVSQKPAQPAHVPIERAKPVIHTGFAPRVLYYAGDEPRDLDATQRITKEELEEVSGTVSENRKPEK